MKKIFIMFLSFVIAFPGIVMAEKKEHLYTVSNSSYFETGMWYTGGLNGAEGSGARFSAERDATAGWNINISQNGYYRVQFYNILYENNREKVNVKVAYDGKDEIYSFNHIGTYSERKFEDVGIFKLHEGDVLNITVSAEGDGTYLRTNSVKVEFYPEMEECIYTPSRLEHSKGKWYSSTLLGYNGTESVYSDGGEGVTKWKLESVEDGLADVYIYNLMHNTNCSKLYVTLSDSEGNLHKKTISHRGEAANAELVYLGRYEFSGTGKEYVEVSGSLGGFVRINALFVKYYCQGFSETEISDYSRRELSEKEVEMYLPDKSAVNIYVKPGSAKGDGSMEKPYPTLLEAKNAVRNIIKEGYPKGGIVVNLMNGRYFTESLSFGAEDSGMEDAPVLWRKYGDDVEITSSKKFNIEEFSTVTDEEILKRIPHEVREKVLFIDVSNIKKDDFNISSPYVVCFGDKQGMISRWPNEGFSRTGDLVDIGTRSDSGPKKRGFKYVVDDEKIFNWEKEPNGYLNGYWMTPYTLDYVKISGIDKKFKTVSGENGTGLGAYDNARYMVLNMMCELDTDGEWYIEGDKLYIILPDGCEDVNVSFVNSTLIDLNGAHDIIFEGLDFINCGKTAVKMSSSAKRCGVRGGKIRHTSGVAVTIAGTGCYIRDCDISDVGGVGIQLDGGNQYHLIHGENYAENNTVTRTGRSLTSKAGITIGGCGNRVSNNHIYNVPTHGINGSGMENIIEKNIVERTNLEMGDTGGIYFLNYGMGYGTKIRYNIVKESVGLNAQDGFTGEGALGIYLDDLTSGVEVYGNILYNLKENAIFGHGGRHLDFSNNVIINCDESITLTKTGILKNLDVETGSAAVNIRKFNTDAIKKKYPEALEALTDEYGEPKYNSILNNVIFDSYEMNVSVVEKNDGTVQGNLYYDNIPDSKCTDFYDLDFSEISAQNPYFEAIPIREVGTYKGGLRQNVDDIIFDNRAEEFEILSPINGTVNIEKKVTFNWETHNGGVKTSKLFISEYPDMSFGKKYESKENSITLELEYGKTYYWKVENEPFLGYDSRFNSNGIFSFTTMSYEDKIKSLEKEIEFLIEIADPVDFEISDINNLKVELENLKNMEAGSDAIDYGKSAIEEFLGEKKIKKELRTVIYDDYSIDVLGEKPYGLFQRSNGNLDIKTSLLPGSSEKGVKFNDDGIHCHYTARYFYPESGKIEFSTRVIPQNSTGQFSMSLIKNGVYPTKDGVSAGNAARIIFDSDGVIYGDKQKNYPLTDYSGGQTYDVKVLLNIKNQSYDVYINKVLLGKNIPVNCDGCESVGSILYDTSDATVKGKESVGVYYIDNTIVRTPQKYGNNSSLSTLFINGKKIDNLNMVTETEFTQEELMKAEITFEAPENVKTKTVFSEGKIFITVLSGDMNSINTYIIK